MYPLSPFPDEQDPLPHVPRPIADQLAGFPEDDSPDQLRVSVGLATKTTPDRAARVFKLRTKTGLPAAVIERNLDDIERQAATQGFDPEKFRRESPLLAEWLQQDAHRAGLVQDDLIPLSTL